MAIEGVGPQPPRLDRSNITHHAPEKKPLGQVPPNIPRVSEKGDSFSRNSWEALSRYQDASGLKNAVSIDSPKLNGLIRAAAERSSFNTAA